MHPTATTEVTDRRNRRWRSGATAIALVIGAAAVGTIATGAVTSGGDSTFTPIQPCRLIDTRDDVALGDNDVMTVQAIGADADCAIPADAVGLSLNVTAVNATMPTHLTIWPGGPRPNVSSLNPVPGEVAYNAVTTLLSTAGSFSVYNLQGTIDVIVDVNGVHLDATISDLVERVSDLETAFRPRAVSTTVSGPEYIDADADAVVWLPEPYWWSEDDATLYGFLTLNYTMTLAQADPDVRVECGVRSGPWAPETFQVWTSSATGDSIGQLSGTARVSASSADGWPAPAVVCSQSGTTTPTTASDAVVTAIFTQDESQGG